MDSSTIVVPIHELDGSALRRLLPHAGRAFVLDHATVTLSLTHPSVHGYLDLNPPNHSHVFEGHFPARAIMPGHWQIEFAALTCAALACLVAQQGLELERDDYGGIRFVQVDGCRFLKEVIPGDRLMCQAEITSKKRPFVFFAATITAIRPSGSREYVCMIEKVVGVRMTGK